MPTLDVVVRTPSSQSFRARQIEALYDVPRRAEQEMEWRGTVPLEDRPWNVGLIVGPSGAGKTTIAKQLFGVDSVTRQHEWVGASVIDDFPAHMSIEDIAAVCQSVGFNTIPAWTRPFHVLSNGEQFRVNIARTLVQSNGLAVVDEFTSVVDRQVAQITSYAVQKYVRRTQQQFVAVTCHYDVEEWLQPDWVLEPATMTFRWRAVQRRPSVDLTLGRVEYTHWRTFAPYHYLTNTLNPAARCFGAFVNGRIAAFAGVLYRPHPKVNNVYGISRVVTLPDFQGLGVAFVLMDAIGSAMRTLKQKLNMYPAHPSFIRSFDKSPKWAMVKAPGVWSIPSKTGDPGLNKGGRPCAVFTYVGPKMHDVNEAKRFLDIPRLYSV